MRWGWLFGNFAEAHPDLDRRGEFEVSRIAHEKHMPTGDLVWVSVVFIVVPALAMLKLAPVALGWMGLGGSTWMTVGTIVVVVVTWPWSAFVYGHLYRRSIRRAMPEVGVDVCPECGYELRDLPGTRTVCPECGTPRPEPSEPATASSETDRG